MKCLFHTMLFFVFCSISFSCHNYKYRDMELYPIMEDGLYGFIDTLGNKVIVPQYICVSNFSNHLALALVDTFYDDVIDSTLYKRGLGYAQEDFKVRCLNMRYGYINIENDFVVNPTLVRNIPVKPNYIATNYDLEKYVSGLTFNEGLAIYQDPATRFYGYIDTFGNKKILAQYYACQDFSSGKAGVKIRELSDKENVSENCFKWGYINKEGEKVSDFIFSYLTPCKNGRSFGTILSMTKDQESHPILRLNENGEFEVEEPVDTSEESKWSIVSVLLDENGNIINNTLRSDYHYYIFGDDGVAVAERWGAEVLGPDIKFIDRSGNYLEPRDVNNMHHSYIGIIPEDYHFSNATPMQEGFAGIMISDGCYVFIDKNLNIYAPIDDEACDGIIAFSNGLAGVCKNGKWGYVDKDFNLIIPLKYSMVYPAGNHLLRVFQKDETSHVVIESYINRKDSIVWQRVDNIQ